MARPLRIDFAGALHHIITRGNERKAVFRDEADRRRYLDLLAQYREKFEFGLLAYCLMDNHVHLAIETGKAPLSRIMAGLQSSYTQYFNGRHRRVGHLFQGRYKAFLVEKDRYALALLRYIHENPVEAGIVASAQEYAWSSDRHYRRRRGPKWLDADRLLAMLGRNRFESLRAYRTLMREPLEEPYEKVENWGQVVNWDEAFADRVLREAGEPRLARGDLTVEEVARVVAGRRGIELTRMISRGQGRLGSSGRMITAWVGREAGDIPIARTAKHFGRDTSTMARSVARLEERMLTDCRLRDLCSELAEMLRSRSTILQPLCSARG